MTVELLDADLPLSQLGEGAYWSSQNSTLYWVDIAGQIVHAYRLADEVHSSWPVSREVSFAFPQQDGHLLVGLSDGVTTTIQRATRRYRLPSTRPRFIAVSLACTLSFTMRAYK